MDEAIPLLLGKSAPPFLISCSFVGSVILVFAVKLLFTQNNNINNNPNLPNNHRRHRSRDDGPAEEDQIIRDLSDAFPDIPLPIIRDQLARNHGDVDIATDALLQIAPRYLDRPPEAASEPKNSEPAREEEKAEIVVDKK